MATLEDESAHITVIRFCVEQGMTPVERHKNLKTIERHANVSRALVYKWHEPFSEGWPENPDRIKRGRPKSDDDSLVVKVQDVINRDRRQTVRDVASVIGCGKSTVQRVLTSDLAMTRVCARWVPRLLTTEQKECRVASSKEFLKRHMRDDTFLDRIITTDGTWLRYFEPESKRQSSVWKTSNSPPPKKARAVKSIGKVMFIMFMDRFGMLLTHAVPAGQTVNAAYYSKVIRVDLMGAIRKKRHTLASDAENIIFHQDIAPSHTAKHTQQELDVIGFQRLVHPPYSPDLAPLDFAYFPSLKSQLRGQKFDDRNELICAALRFTRNLGTEWFSEAYHKWFKRHRKCVKHNGEYFEKE